MHRTLPKQSPWPHVGNTRPEPPNRARDAGIPTPTDSPPAIETAREETRSLPHEPGARCATYANAVPINSVKDFRLHHVEGSAASKTPEKLGPGV